MLEQSMIYIISNLQENPMFFIYILIPIIIIVLLVYFLLISKKSNFSDNNLEEQNRRVMVASILLYNDSFAGRERGQEDTDWNTKLYNKELEIHIDENLFRNVFATPQNVVNEKWVRLSLPKF